jgi:hypothetical protein
VDVDGVPVSEVSERELLERLHAGQGSTLAVRSATGELRQLEIPAEVLLPLIDRSL